MWDKFEQKVLSPLYFCTLVRQLVVPKLENLLVIYMNVRPKRKCKCEDPGFRKEG